MNLEDKGLVIMSVCAHAGIVNTIKQGQRLTKTQKIHAVIGGFHLKDSKDERIEATIEDLVQTDPDSLYPCHCT